MAGFAGISLNSGAEIATGTLAGSVAQREFSANPLGNSATQVPTIINRDYPYGPVGDRSQ